MLNIKNGKSLRVIAKELNIRHSTVRVNFVKLGLIRRTLAEAQTGERNHEWKDGNSAKKGRVYKHVNQKRFLDLI